MRSLGLIGLVLALLVVGVVAKKQMGGGSAAAPAVRAQSEQVQQQVRQQLDAASQARPMPDDAK